MCRIHSLLTQPENPALIVNPITNNNNGGLNYARCSPVLPKSDSCPAEKDYLTLPNMSLLQNNSATNQSKSNTRTDSWVESFVDLSEFCYPTITHTRMADSADELNTPTISSTVQHRGFGNLSDVNENLRILSENNNKWYAQSPIFMREELSDPITDWLTTTSNKDSTTMINNVTTNSLLEALSSSTNNVTTNNNDNNNNVQNNNVQNNNVNDILLNHHQMLLLDDINRYDTNIVDMNYKIKNDPLLSSSALPPHHLQPAADSTFTTRRVGSNSAHTPRTIASLFACSYKPKLNVSATAVRPSSVAVADTITTTVSSPNNVQSPSISQSHLNLDESHTEFKIPSPGLVKRRNVKLDLKFGDGPFNPPCSMNTPEVLKPLVDKDLEFDLVSYVFEDNKPAAKILPSDDIVVTTGENITNEVVPLQTPKTDRYQGALLDSKLLLLDIAIKSEPPDIEDVVIIEPGCGGIKKNSNDHNNSNNVALNNIIVDDGDDDDNKDAIIGSDYNRDIIEEVIIGGGAAAGVEDDDKITPDFIDEIVISSNSNFNTNNNRNRLRTDSTNSSDNSSSNQDDVNSKRAAIITNRRNSSAVRLLSAYSPRRVRGSNNKVVVGGGKAVAAMKRKYEDTDDDDLEEEEEEVEELGEREIEEIEEIFRPRTIGVGKTLSIFNNNNNNNNKNSSSSSSNSSNSTDDSKGKNDDKRRLSITDIALIESEKYRELRDRNNEASRRSRANRKTREVELQMQADVLEAENRSLKLRAERMEQLVKRLREILMKMVLKNNRIP